MKLDELKEKTLQWSSDRGILANGKITTQALKLGSEVGELMDNAAKDNLEAMKDDIGDCLVVLTNLAHLAGTTLEECWEVAYNDIKDRKGFLNKNGTFIKETDAAYKELVAKHKLELSPEYTKEPLIVELCGNTTPGAFNICNIGIILDNKQEMVLYVTLYNGCTLCGDFPYLFIGKTVGFLKDYLKTVGKINRSEPSNLPKR